MKINNEKRQLYFAYGANTNIDSMSVRCPKAELVGKWILPNWRLTFRNVADIEYAYKDKVHGVLWRITDECEKSLDRFEGYPYLYRKEYISVSIGNNKKLVEDLMWYKMNRSDESLPCSTYYDGIREGYVQNGIDPVHLESVVEKLSRKIEIRNETYNITNEHIDIDDIRDDNQLKLIK
tara:strand:+ start:1084 stop:1620 length:537 start_codon:yes stop_codon:yes gene_type:complete